MSKFISVETKKRSGLKSVKEKHATAMNCRIFGVIYCV